jgi:hypothetical protein
MSAPRILILGLLAVLLIAPSAELIATTLPRR